MAADGEILAGSEASWPSIDQATSALRASWAPLDERQIDGWRLGFSEGFTRRANSVWMLGGVADARAAIGEVEEAYRVRGLPSRFLSTEASDPRDLAALAAFGYSPVLRGKILACAGGEQTAGREPDPNGAGASEQIVANAGFASQPGPDVPQEWLDAWLHWSGRRLPSDRRLAPRILRLHTSQFLSLRVDGALAAVARVAVIDSIGVIDCLVTERASRGRGYGRRLIAGAQREAARLGATACIAMVVDSNAASLRLFDRAGYGQLGSFCYLEGPERISCC